MFLSASQSLFSYLFFYFNLILYISFFFKLKLSKKHKVNQQVKKCLNTSYVKVQCITEKPKEQKQNLNTSYVKVQFIIQNLLIKVKGF